MPSEVYSRIWQAVRERKQIIFSYKGGARETCPLVLGLQLREGPWIEGTSHKQAQSCVRWVDVDVNIPEMLTRPAPLPFGSPQLRAPRTTGNGS
jgi:hypothetical protein